MQNSLCWYCKRLTDENHVCPWVDDGIPVEGWTIEDVHDINPDHISNGVAKTGTVVSCPLFIKEHTAIRLSEFLNKAATEIDVPRWRVNRNPEAFLSLYEKKVGKVPEWVVEEMNIIHENMHKN